MERTIELYNLLKGPLGEEGSRAVVTALEEVERTVKSESKDILKDAQKGYAEKADIARLEGKIEVLEGKIEKLRSDLRHEMRLNLFIVIAIILITNPRALDIIARLFGMMK